MSSAAATIVAAPAVPGLTAERLARRIGRSQYVVELVLADCLERGLVEQHLDGRWALSVKAERAFGVALRELGH